ncbi:MAG: DNA polymerase III subunit delta [Deltaproteobacteria bacterium]|jgi:DNA polymerase-3 subunit delta|nr:DNA polymerase III subunit delta [Deltaproteobacteria bacterium]
MEIGDFIKELSSPRRKPFYLVFGGDPAATRLCLETARNVVDPSFAAFNYRQFSLEELEKSKWKQLTSELISCPFGPAPKIVVLLVNETEKPSADGLESLGKLRPRINSASTLIMILQGKADERFKFFKDVAKEGVDVDCRAPDKANLPGWLIARFKDQGLKIDPDTARFMIDRIGQNPGALLNEVAKLAVYPGPEKPINVKDISSFVCHGPTAEMYELGAPLAEGKLQTALPILSDLLETSAPLVILKALGTYFFKMIRVKAILDETEDKATNAALSSGSGAHPFQVKRIRSQLEHWSLPALKTALEALEETQRAMVTSSAPPELALQALAVKLACLAKGTA